MSDRPVVDALDLDGRGPAPLEALPLGRTAALVGEYRWIESALYSLLGSWVAEMPVAAVYISELSKARGRGKFFLLYEMIFPIGLMATGLVVAGIVDAGKSP